MLLDKFQMIANCYRGSNVLHMLILHSKCSINVPTSCVRPGTCRNIWNVPNLLSVGKWQVLSTRACNVLKMFLLVSRPPRPQCSPNGPSQQRLALHKTHKPEDECPDEPWKWGSTKTEQLGRIEALEEELRSSRGKVTELEQKMMEQDRVIAQLVGDNLDHLQDNMRLTAHITLGARGPGNQQKHLEYIAGSG